MPLENINALTSPELQMNANFAAVAWAAVYAMAFRTTSGLVWGYLGGRWGGFVVADGTFTLTASNTNYIVVLKSSGATSCSTSITNWNDATNYRRVYKLTTGVSAVTAIEDHRAGPQGVHGQ